MLYLVFIIDAIIILPLYNPLYVILFMLTF